MNRKKTRQIHVGSVPVGGGAPISVQSMTNTDTSDAEATAAQVAKLGNAGADIVRVSVPDKASADALARVVRASKVPLVADIHFDYRMAVMAADAGAACIRINPGNIGSEAGIREVVAAASANGCPIRIGVNSGSLERRLLEKYGEPCAEAMVESALEQIRILERHGFGEVKVSLKSSDTRMTIAAYEKMSELSDCPLHLGITEAGTMVSGTVKSALGIGHLLLNGIGDTLRVSLSEDPVEEVRVGWEILRAAGLRSRGVEIVSCPTCARRGLDVVAVANEVERKLSDITRPVRVSIMGCAVNGIGEAKKSDFGIVGIDLPKGRSAVFVRGEKSHEIDNSNAADEIVRLVRNFTAK